MTELEKQLLDAFSALHEQHNEQHQTLQEMFKRTATENAALQRQVNSLEEQVRSLTALLRPLSKRSDNTE